MPEKLRATPCLDCQHTGYSPEAEVFYEEWYGYTPFDPRSTGSVPFEPTSEVAQAWGKRQTERSPEYYGSGQAAIDQEAVRICGIWNGSWSHHLTQEDVDALVADDRLWDFTKKFVPGEGWQELENPVMPTAAEINLWSLNSFGHDGVNAGVCIRARAERENVPLFCATCEGECSVESFEGQRKEAEEWEATEPPVGSGWQLWETVSEGSPVTPVFATAEELAEHIVGVPSLMGPSSTPMSTEDALAWVTGAAWAPTIAFRVAEG